MNKNIFILVIFIFSTSLYSQTPSKRELLNLDSISMAYLDQDKEKAIEYSIDYLNATKQYENNEYIGHAYHRLGYIYSTLGNYSESIFNYLMSIKHRRKYADSIGVGECYYSIAYAFYKASELDKAIHYNTLSINLLRSFPNNKFLYYNYLNLSRIFQEKEEYDKAIKQLEKCREIGISIKNIENIAIANTYTASIYRKMKIYSSATMYDSICLVLSQQANDINGIARALNNLGYSYYSKGNYNEAIKYFKKSISYKSKIEIANAYLSLADAYIKENNIKEAENALQHAWNYHPNIEDYANTTKAIALYYKRKGSLKASDYFEKLSQVNDSLKRLSSTNYKLSYISPYKIQEVEQRYMDVIHNESIAIQALIQRERYIFIAILSCVLLVISLGLLKSYLAQKKLYIIQKRQYDQNKHDYIVQQEKMREAKQLALETTQKAREILFRK